MSLRIQNNVEAFNAHRNLASTEGALATSMERLSSGYRINRAADDAAGLALTEVHSMLQRVRDLAVQYNNGSLSSNDRTAIQSEVNQLASEIERIGQSAQFNGINVLNTTQTLSFQVGAQDGQVISMSLISLGSQVGVSFAPLTATGASDIAEIDAAIDVVS